MAKKLLLQTRYYAIDFGKRDLWIKNRGFWHLENCLHAISNGLYVKNLGLGVVVRQGH